MSDERENQGTAGAGPASEYEREPVPAHALLGFSSFVGQYAGEHTAGTELMIGPLFVAAGVSAFDLVVGLLVGNLLAVLSWTFLTAPIATRARLTLYYQLEQICGRNLVTIYNVANGVMFCFLAGAMITVNATAAGVWFDFRMPALNDLYPNSAGWVAASLVMGLLVTVVAAWGYCFVARVANVAAPWMVLVFLAFGLVGLRQLGVTSIGDFWADAPRVIWKGGDPLPGQVKFTFWHVMFFAWFCNMAMHIGMRICRCSGTHESPGSPSPRRPECISATSSPGWRRRSSMPSSCTRTRPTSTCFRARWLTVRAASPASCA